MIKLFLSHASEDKCDFVRPLALRLQQDFKVWYDEFELVMGDSLLKKIDEGLRQADYGVVVLSHAFFSKKWPQTELDGLFALETSEKKVILPIWKDITEPDVRFYSPTLAGRLGAPASLGIEGIVAEIKRAVGTSERLREVTNDAWKNKFAKIDADVAHKRAAEARSGTVEGVQEVTAIARQIIVEAKRRGEELKDTLKTIGLHIPAKTGGQDSFSIQGPGQLTLHFYFSAPVTNSVAHASLRVAIFRDKDAFSDRDFEIIEKVELKPEYGRDFSVCWSDGEHQFAAGDAILDYGYERFAHVIENRLNNG